MPGKMRSYEPRPKPGRGAASTRGQSPRNGMRKPETTGKPVRAYHMIGGRTVGNVGEISSELPTRGKVMVFMLARAEEPAEGSQSVRSSEEAGNDRRAKGRRKVNA